jgi:hypothetical protein
MGGKERIDDHPLDKDRGGSAGFLATYQLYIAQHWGDRCEEIEPGCPCCDMWILFDQVKAKIDFALQ